MKFEVLKRKYAKFLEEVTEIEMDEIVARYNLKYVDAELERGYMNMSETEMCNFYEEMNPSYIQSKTIGA
ncbi:MAG: hypothetical protein ACRCVJ_18675 [Clostridium sp.]|uniref:hypothetical protein n=1 Tax=Clostridium sp. TaxID=1506 RepID=UPI003F4086B3